MRDQRRYVRVPVAWPVRLWVEEAAIIGHAHDASTHGLGITLSSTVVVKRGRSYSVDVLADDPASLAIAAEVRYVNGRRIGLEVKRPLALAESAPGRVGPDERIRQAPGAG